MRKLPGFTEGGDRKSDPALDGIDHQVIGGPHVRAVFAETHGAVDVARGQQARCRFPGHHRIPSWFASDDTAPPW